MASQILTQISPSLPLSFPITFLIFFQLKLFFDAFSPSLFYSFSFLQMAKYQQELDDAINQPLPEGDDDDL